MVKVERREGCALTPIPSKSLGIKDRGGAGSVYRGQEIPESLPSPRPLAALEVKRQSEFRDGADKELLFRPQPTQHQLEQPRITDASISISISNDNGI